MEIHRSDLAIGLAGMAIMRRMSDRPDEIREVASLLETALADDPEPGFAPIEMTPWDGYAEWAATYDETANAMVSVEEPVVDAILARLEPARALDVACGTGRHARRLAELGWEVTGVDASAEMLDVARSKLPGIRFEEGDLTELPIESDSVDLTVCGLALTHVSDLRPAVVELARVTTPGGSIVTTDIHPFATATGAHAFYGSRSGERRFIRNRTHLHSDYLDAFTAAGLEIVGCEEPGFQPEPMTGTESTVMQQLLTYAVAGLPGILAWHCRVM